LPSASIEERVLVRLGVRCDISVFLSRLAAPGGPVANLIFTSNELSATRVA